MSKWQEIDTAPKNGSRVILYMEEHSDEGDPRQVACWLPSTDAFAWAGDAWYTDTGEAWTAPTHWMPLPEPPPKPLKS